MIGRALRGWLPKEPRRHRILAGPLRGSALYTSWHDYPAAITGRTELELVRWILATVRPGETWLDVGAHYGYTSIALGRAAGVHGRVVAFEPVIQTCGLLVQTLQANQLDQVTAVPVALGETDSLMCRQVPTVRGMADSTYAGDESLRLLEISLDTLWKPLASDVPIDGIKIDVQGMELHALLGMRRLLQRDHPTLVLEFHRGVNRSEILDLLQSSGYDRAGRHLGPSGPLAAEYSDDTSYTFCAAQD